MITKTYDPQKIVLSFANQMISGYADGTFITAERNEDAFKVTVGAGGEAARTRIANRSGKVTVTLLASSPTNDFLSSMAAQDELEGNGTGPLQVKDSNGTTLISASAAWIVKQPGREWGKELGTCKWVIETADLRMHAGGNTL